MQKTMLALVTGASGFIGSHLCESLKNNGFRVRAFVRNPKTCTHLTAHVDEWVQGDLQNLESLKKAVQAVDIIYHLGAVLFPLGANSSSNFFDQNRLGTQNLLKAIEETLFSAQPPRFILVSSQAAGGPIYQTKVGIKDTPRHENLPDQPVSFYGKSKLQSEALLSPYLDKFPVLIARPSAVYGPRDTAFLPVFDLIQKYRLGVYYPASQFQMIYVQDLCEALCKMGQISSFVSGDKFYLTHELVVDDRTLMEWIADALDVKSKVRYIKVGPKILKAGAWVSEVVSKMRGKKAFLNRDKMTELLASPWVCSTQKAATQLGFKAQTDHPKKIADTARWYREQGWLKK